MQLLHFSTAMLSLCYHTKTVLSLPGTSLPCTSSSLASLPSPSAFLPSTSWSLPPRPSTSSSSSSIASIPRTSNPSTLTQTSATYYFRVGQDVAQCIPVQNFGDTPTYGSCGTQYSPQSKYWVAIANGKNHCGKKILATHKDTSVVLTVMDTCNACEVDNHLDMGLEALIELTGSSTTACAVNQPLPRVSWYFM
jgi:hypothetical protein